MTGHVIGQRSRCNRSPDPGGLLAGPDGNGAVTSLNQTPERFSETLPAYAGNVSVLRHGLVAFAERHGAGPLATADIALAVGEALNNVVIHAYREHAVPGDMTVDAHVEQDRLAVAVTDQGSGPSPRVDSPGMGLGMPVMASLSPTMSIGVHSPADRSGTIVLLNFTLAG